MTVDQVRKSPGLSHLAQVLISNVLKFWPIFLSSSRDGIVQAQESLERESMVFEALKRHPMSYEVIR